MAGWGDGRRPVRTDEQIRGHVDDVDLLRAIAAGRFRTRREHRRALQRLAHDECILGGIVLGTTPILLSRGARVLADADAEPPDSDA